MCYFDHPPPHIHVEFNKHKARFAIKTAKIMDETKGIRKNARNMVEAWIEMHKEKLLECWDLAQQGHKPSCID